MGFMLQEEVIQTIYLVVVRSHNLWTEFAVVRGTSRKAVSSIL